MAVICPTVLAADPHHFRDQMDRVTPFASRVQIDLTDGIFASPSTMSLESIWWPSNIQADIHLMYQKPTRHLKLLKQLNPSLVIVHAEADGNFFEIATSLKQAGIKVGVALLKDTPVKRILPALPHIDHVLIFSGDLGRFGGEADLSLLTKIAELRRHPTSQVEVGWDGGINSQNACQLAEGGVDVLNVGGFIQRADNPQQAYATLEQTLNSQQVNSQ